MAGRTNVIININTNQSHNTNEMTAWISNKTPVIRSIREVVQPPLRDAWGQ